VTPRGPDSEGNAEPRAESLPFAFAGDPQKMWREFVRLFEADIHRRIACRFRAQYATREDMYQEVCLKLVENDFRRIRVYRASGSFRAYLMRVVDNIVLDALRREIPGQREARPTSRRSRIPVRSISLTERDDLSIRDAAPDPEETLIGIEEERLLHFRLEAVKSAFTSFTAEQQVFLTIISSVSDSIPPRQIARLMRLKVRAVYQLRRSVRRQIIRALGKPQEI
jgi:RNA polymerase sigma factor (sigma-70 family)